MTWKARLRDLALVALAFAIGTVGLTAYTVYRIWDVGQQDNRRHVDAIVVLGAAQYNGRPSAVLAARLDHAIDLYKQGYAPWFVVTGGKQPGDRVTEAATERSYAVARGVPASAILAETTGATTLESIRNVRTLFDEHGLHTALFVSDRTHMLRVLLLAAGSGNRGVGLADHDQPGGQRGADALRRPRPRAGRPGRVHLPGRRAASATPSATPSPTAGPTATSTATSTAIASPASS